jgi:hypothetical protein
MFNRIAWISILAATLIAEAAAQDHDGKYVVGIRSGLLNRTMKLSVLVE